MSRTQLFFAFSFLTIVSHNALFASEHAPYASFGFKSMDHWKSPTAKETEQRKKEDEAKPKNSKPSTPTRKQLLPARIAAASAAATMVRTVSAPSMVTAQASSAQAQRANVISPSQCTLPDEYDPNFYLTTPKAFASIAQQPKPADQEKVPEKD